MKNLVTLQSIYEQALELLIKYNPNADVGNDWELIVMNSQKVVSLDNKRSKLTQSITISYMLKADTTHNIQSLSNNPKEALSLFESQLKQHALYHEKSSNPTKHL